MAEMLARRASVGALTGLTRLQIVEHAPDAIDLATFDDLQWRRAIESRIRLL